MTNPILPYPADIRPLTSLRFFAAVVVIFTHLKYFIPFSLEPYTRFEGYLAVDFFFILSGFILTHAYIDSRAAGTFQNFDFWRKRLARLYPVHAVTLILMAGVGLTALQFGPIREWPGDYVWMLLGENIMLVHAWGGNDDLGFNVPSWSVSAEWFAYLFFPILLTLSLRTRPSLLLIFSAVAYASIWLISHDINPARPITKITNDFSMFRIMPAFVLGIALYRFKATRPPNPQAMAGVVICAFLSLIVIHKGYLGILVIPFFSGIIIWAADLSRLPKPTWLSHAVPVWLGKISYSLYMIHYPCMVLILYAAQISMAKDVYKIHFIWLAPLCLALSLAAAALLYHYVERPGRRWLAGQRAGE